MGINSVSNPGLEKLRKRFQRLYGSRARQCVERLRMLLGRYGVEEGQQGRKKCWDQTDVALITYGDMVSLPNEAPLVALRKFLRKHLEGLVREVHVLPFFPYSSDDGFSIIDHREVDPKLGKCDDLEGIGKDFRLMVDLVLNHVSQRSDWFEDYIEGVAPWKDYFIEVDPAVDLSTVVRPRSGPLLKQVRTALGERHVWTTFSEDQIDLNYRNPHVLLEFIDILCLYISKGARVIRLDAIAYLWKKLGTSCIHLPETHEVVKVFRDVMELVAPDAWLITETNVPQEENVSYFGNGDEAHIVYQFSLPPLLLHALISGDIRYLKSWAASWERPPEGCTVLNFTASHDGIGLRPLEGIVPGEQIASLIDKCRSRGGRVSYKRDRNGRESPYELNITYVDALAAEDERHTPEHVGRFLVSQAVALSLAGIPAIYLPSLVGAGNDYEAVGRTGRARSINRRKFGWYELEEKLADEACFAHQVFKRYTRLLRVRRQHPAFHPDAGQRIIDMGNSVFALEREAYTGRESILVLSNFTGLPVSVPRDSSAGAKWRAGRLRDCIEETVYECSAGKLELGAYQTVWLVPEVKDGT